MGLESNVFHIAIFPAQRFLGCSHCVVLVLLLCHSIWYFFLSLTVYVRYIVLNSSSRDYGVSSMSQFWLIFLFVLFVLVLVFKNIILHFFFVAVVCFECILYENLFLLLKLNGLEWNAFEANRKYYSILFLYILRMCFFYCRYVVKVRKYL